MNKLLLRQLQKHFGKTDEIPEDFIALLNAVSETYDHYEKDRKMIERSIDLSSREMIELNCLLKKEKDELKKAHQEIKTLFQNVDDVLYSADIIQGKLTQVSDACEKVYGYSPAEFMTNPELWYKVIHPEDRHIIAQQIEDLSRGRHVFNQYRIIHKDKTIRWLENKIIPTYNDSGNLVRLDGVTADISDRKAEEKKLVRSEANLELKNKELELKNKELEQFAYVASHDLQEPLRTTSAFTELLLNQYHGRLDQKADQYLVFISQSIDRMKALIKDLLDYSRIGKKREWEKVDCNCVLNDVLADLDVAIKETQTIIQSGPLPVIKGYPTEIKQLFQNLVVNAIKFRKKDTAPEIKITAKDAEGNWEFWVSDNGIGIEAEHQERIFIIFQRLHTRNQYEGSGIGLAHCKKIVELHGGKLWVESKPGEGSTFYFTIRRI